MAEKLHQVKGIVKIGEEIYIPEELAGSAISENHVIPVYFGVSYSTEIHHDSPAIGAYELGETTNNLHGPFFSKKEAEQSISKDSENTDKVSYEFSSRIIIRLFNPEQLPNEQLPRVFRYYRNNFSLSNSDRYDRLEYFLHPNLAPTPEKVIHFSQILEKRLREYSKELKEIKGELVGIVNNQRPFFIEMKTATEDSLWFRYSTFSEEPTPESFSAELAELGISHRAPQISPARSFISFSPVVFSPTHDSIEDLVKYYGMIH